MNELKNHFLNQINIFINMITRLKNILQLISLPLLFNACQSPAPETALATSTKQQAVTNNNQSLLLEPLTDSAVVQALIEIPAGTIDKWELNKSTGQLEWELVDNQPRKINYIGYPGNYGMIPKTLLPKEAGGDGDPLDILVLGPPVQRGTLLRCKIIGVLRLLDHNEQDDKLIAIASGAPFSAVSTLKELVANHFGIPQIIELWFENYKGPGKIKSAGFGNRNEALKLLEKAQIAYRLNQQATKH